RVARLSNVYGEDWSSQNFLTDLLRDAILGRELKVEISPESSKDYIALDDVLEALPKIAAEGRHRLYNVASGQSVSNRALLDRICAETGCSWRVRPGAPDIAFPQIDVSRLTEEFHFQPASLLDRIPELVALYRGSQHASGVSRP
ncbi:MAG: sugar nucleotide epimerase, partial [Pseudomonadota bacterium]